MNVSSFEKFSSVFDSTLLRHQAKTCKKKKGKKNGDVSMLKQILISCLLQFFFFFCVCVFNIRAEKVLFLGDSKASFQKLRAQNEAVDNYST